MSRGPLYEKTVYVEPGLADEFATWLDQHLVDAATVPGVTGVDQAATPADADERPGFTWRYAFENDESLDVFLERETNESYPGAQQTFGEAAAVGSRVLREDSAYAPEDGAPKACLNCGATLRGQYCGNCGQRARTRLISLWELIRDAFGDLFELDSRIWQTLIPLLVRPGKLTYDYLAGRRARYMPPFRMYLVMSLVFFVIAFFNPREELSLLYLPEEAAESETTDSEPADAEVSNEESEPPAIPEEARPQPESLGPDVDQLNADLAEEGDGDSCDVDDFDISDMPQWIQDRLTRSRVEAICERIEAGRFGDQVLDNVPLALFVLLPLMALVQVFLYPLSRRYYVEHLLFFLHYHAFFFLILTLMTLWARLVASVGGPDWLAILPIVAASFYIPVYLFKSMRRVYEQGWFLTFFKFLLLVFAYSIGFGLTMLLAFLVAVMGA